MVILIVTATVLTSGLAGAAAGYLPNSVPSTGYYNYLSIQGAFFIDYTNHIRKTYY